MSARMIVMVIILCLTVQEAAATVELHKVEVVDFQEKENDTFLLRFVPLDKISFIKKNGVVSLYIKFDRDCVTSLKQSENIQELKKKYLSSVSELKRQMALSKNIYLGLKSGKGFHKVPGESLVYQSGNLAILHVKKKKFVYVIHSDVGSGYCDGVSNRKGQEITESKITESD